jgi:hypothetical protein
MGCCAFSTKDDTIDNKDGFDIAIKYPSGIDGISINPQGETNEIENINVWIKSHFKNKSISWIVYNNEHDDKEHSSFAHSKGIVSFEKNNIIWLIHSVPNYPATFDENGPSDIEDGSHIYGQSFICLKLDLKYKDLIIEHLKVQHAYITITNIPKYNKHFEKVESFTITINGTIIHLLSKPKKWDNDIYSDYIKHHFNESWKFQTWIRGHESPETHNVTKVQNINWPNKSWHTTHDHSKVGVSHKKYVCISSLNLMTSQKIRGGESVIIESEKLATIFNKIYLE